MMRSFLPGSVCRGDSWAARNWTPTVCARQSAGVGKSGFALLWRAVAKHPPDTLGVTFCCLRDPLPFISVSALDY